MLSMKTVILAIALLAAYAVAEESLYSARYGDVGPVRRAHVHPQSADVSHRILLKEHVLDTTEHEGLTEEHSRRLSREEADTVHQFLVHVGRPLTDAERADIVSAVGVPMGSYFPHFTHLMQLTIHQALAVKKHPLVKWVGLFHPEFKGARNIPTQLHAGLSQEDVQLLVSLPEQDAPRDIQEVEALARKWTNKMQGSGFPVRVEASSSRRLLVTISPPVGGRRDDSRASGRTVAEWLAEQPESHYIEVKPVMVTHNSYSQGITQGGSNGKTTLWDRGITGKGQVVGVGDSGIDYDACFFHDPNNDTPLSSGNTNVGGINPNHRKIVNYHEMNGADSLDDPDGHGTHVAGSAAGSTFDDASPLAGYNGMAKDAQIAFLDIGTPQGLTGVPNDLYQSFFGLGYEAGARIHTNSWGAPCFIPGQGCIVDGSGLCSQNAYTPFAVDADRFMWENKDFLILFAAGNDGSSGCNPGGAGTHTTASPATAKNILSVGATLNANEAHVEFCNYLASIGVIVDPTDCINFHVSQSDIYNERSMADFSSRGPSRDIRIKPDVVAPGNPIFSARSDGNPNTQNCGDTPDDVLLSGGTSMATPIVAGNAALVRQYLAEGWYPSGEKRSGDSIEPSAALVKALIINSGREMPGVIDIAGNQQFSQLDTTPSVFHGYGAVQLDAALYFNDDTQNPNRDLLIKYNDQKQDPEIGLNEVHEDCYEILNPAEPAKFTLVWTDNFGDPTTGVALVNDLDLVVEKDGQTWVGNGPFSEKYGAAPTDPDRRNNVEQVIINNPAAGSYCVKITGVNMGKGGTQPYAFVASGGFDPANKPSSAGPDKSGPSAGATVGIVIGVVVGVAVIALVGVYYKKNGGSFPLLNKGASSSSSPYVQANTDPGYKNVVPGPSGYRPPAYNPSS